MPYIEGDNLHPKSNVDKMSSGHSLDDVDREPWLELIRSTTRKLEVQASSTKGHPPGVVVGCSALKKYYREILRGKRKPAIETQQHLQSAPSHNLLTYFVFIEGSRETLMERLEKRSGHFMKASMLDSQLQTLESPVGEEGVVTVSALDITEGQVERALEGLSELWGPGFDVVDLQVR